MSHSDFSISSPCDGVRSKDSGRERGASNRTSPAGTTSGYSGGVSVTLSGQVERITYENEQTGFRVVRLGKLEGQGARGTSAVVVGTFQAVGPGMRLRVSGDYVVDARHGEQCRTFLRSLGVRRDERASARSRKIPLCSSYKVSHEPREAESGDRRR